ncbi:hypothetical protein LJK88_09445 [Paenibacillus sp. P26]|nr:hypothetical protein LJK88_09445 [Paenibacillus sp. P26]
MIGSSLLHPISNYFNCLHHELVKALEQAQQEGTIRKELDVHQLAASLSAIVQGGYVLSRALQNPAQMEWAVNGAIAMLAEMERRS